MDTLWIAKATSLDYSWIIGFFLSKEEAEECVYMAYMEATDNNYFYVVEKSELVSQAIIPNNSILAELPIQDFSTDGSESSSSWESGEGLPLISEEVACMLF